MSITTGMNLSRAVDAAAELGVEVERLRRTGELFFRHPLMGKPVRSCGHRKDATRHLTVWLKALQRRLRGGEAA
jgi:hypothetical protein